MPCPHNEITIVQRSQRQSAVAAAAYQSGEKLLSDTICIENGLSIVENPKPHSKSYDQWLGDQAKPYHRELLRAAIDNALAQKPADLDELLKLLRESGCEVSKRGKSYRLKLPGWGKVSRLDSLGDGCTLEHLLAVLAGQKEHTPRQKPVRQEDPPKVNLLVDIQAKLQAGKGAGYVRWAKVFNLKQMAQTVNYLTEHNLLEYTTDFFVDVTEEVMETIRAAERAEAAYERKMYRYKAQYSLDCENGIENAVLLKPQTPEMVLEEKQFQEQVYAAVMKLPEKQAKRIYARYYLGMAVNEIAEVEGVDPSRVRDSIRRGLKQLVKYF